MITLANDQKLIDSVYEPPRGKTNNAVLNRSDTNQSVQ